MFKGSHLNLSNQFFPFHCLFVEMRQNILKQILKKKNVFFNIILFLIMSILVFFLHPLKLKLKSFINLLYKSKNFRICFKINSSLALFCTYPNKTGFVVGCTVKRNKGNSSYIQILILKCCQEITWENNQI